MFFILLVVLVLFASSAQAAGLCPVGWQYFEENCYAFGRIKLTWADAAATCSAGHARLAEVQSESKNNFLKNLSADKKVDCVWLGGTDMFQEKQWTWLTTGQPIESFTNWPPGEPNNLFNSEHCLDLYSHLGYSWNDAPCDHKCNFICEQRSNNHVKLPSTDLTDATDIIDLSNNHVMLPSTDLTDSTDNRLIKQSRDAALYRRYRHNRLIK